MLKLPISGLQPLQLTIREKNYTKNVVLPAMLHLKFSEVKGTQWNAIFLAWVQSSSI